MKLHPWIRSAESQNSRFAYSLILQNLTFKCPKSYDFGVPNSTMASNSAKTVSSQIDPKDSWNAGTAIATELLKQGTTIAIYRLELNPLPKYIIAAI